MENKTKGKKISGSLVTIIILTICVLGLGGFIGYDKFIKDNSCPKTESTCSDKKTDSKTNSKTIETKTDTSVETKCEEEVSYSYEEMEGVYKTTLSTNLGNSRYYLTLYKNGTFRYVYSVEIKEGFMGNYTIKGNKIILNKLFRTGNDMSLVVMDGSKELIINEDKTITDNDQPYSQYSDTKSITFTKSADEIDDDFNYMLKNYVLVNETKAN